MKKKIKMLFILNDHFITEIYTLSLHSSFPFFFNDPATTEIYPLSLHDALPISVGAPPLQATQFAECGFVSTPDLSTFAQAAAENIVIDPPAGVMPDSSAGPDGFPINFSPQGLPRDRKSVV